MNNTVVVYISSDDIAEVHRTKKLIFRGTPVLSPTGEKTGEIVTVEIRQWYPWQPDD